MHIGTLLIPFALLALSHPAQTVKMSTSAGLEGPCTCGVVATNYTSIDIPCPGGSGVSGSLNVLDYTATPGACDDECNPSGGCSISYEMRVVMENTCFTKLYVQGGSYGSPSGITTNESLGTFTLSTNCASGGVPSATKSSNVKIWSSNPGVSPPPTPVVDHTTTLECSTCEQ